MDERIQCDNVASVRELHGVSRERMAEVLNMKFSSYCRYEESLGFTEDELRIIANELGVSSETFGIVDDKSGDSIFNVLYDVNTSPSNGLLNFNSRRADFFGERNDGVSIFDSVKGSVPTSSEIKVFNADNAVAQDDSEISQNEEYITTLGEANAKSKNDTE